MGRIFLDSNFGQKNTKVENIFKTGSEEFISESFEIIMNIEREGEKKT